MKRNLLWRFLFVVFVVLWSLWELYPPQSRNLIDEFANRAVNTDTNFTAIVEQARKLEQANPDRSFLNLRTAIGTNDITRYFPAIKPSEDQEPTVAILHQLQRDAAGQIKLGLDLQGGTSFLVAMDTSKLDTNKASVLEERQFALEQAIEVLRKRVDTFGVSEPIIQPAGQDRILIQLPGLSEAEKESAKNTIEKAAFLEFRLVHPESDQRIAQGLTAPGYELKKMKARQRGNEEPRVYSYLVKKTAEQGLTGSYVKQAMVTSDPISNQPQIALSFNSEGAAKFAEITRNNVGNQLAIILDGELYSAPVIRVPILDGNAVIEGDFTVKEAYELANVLENPLEVPVDIVEERSVEPSLGKDSIRAGIRASVIGTILVAGFMLVYYLFAGFVANIALVLNVILLLGVMCSIDTTLTLPGIAGIVLTIGMAVDANILIFERIREELAAGKSMRGALAAGYDKAFGTIFDSNLTTLIASVILILLGTGPIKGFGVSLTIGLVVNMFTALVVTRLIFDWLLARGWLKSLRMLSVVKQTHFDFLRWSKHALVLSAVVIVSGIASGIYRGKGALGVDFLGGDSLTFSYKQKIELDQLRRTLIELKVGDPVVQYQKDLATGEEVLQVTTAYDTAAKVREALQQKFPEAGLKVEATEGVGPTVGLHILRSALISVLLSLFGILIYVAFRYEFSFAIGAVVAVIHDVFVTMGLFCLTGREFNAPMVAAILTVIGFSVNDTIVVFDRIREDLKLGIRGSLKDVMNTALNQTLSRTIITSGTVLMATFSLYAFGGPVINDFAFTFLVGILTGTYSTVYLASAVVLWWNKGERPKASSPVAIDSAVTARV